MANAGSVTVEIGANTSNFDRKMREVDTRLNRLGSRTSSVGRGFSIFGRGVDRAHSSLARVTRGASSAILSFIGLRGAVLAASGGFLGGAGLVYAMQKAVGIAINVEEQINKVRVVFGQSAAGILSWSKTTATGIGLARSSALEAVGTFGNMLRPLGILPRQAAVMSRSLVNLAGDMSSFNNASLEDTLIAIRAGLAGEVEPLRRFGVFLSETRLKAEAIRSGFAEKGFKGVLDPLVKSLSAYNLILKDTKLTQGDYNRTQNSTANIIRTIKAQVTDLAGVFGQGLEPVVNRVGRTLREKLGDPQFQQRVRELGRLFGEKLYSAIQKVGTWFQQNWGGISEGFRTAGDYLSTAASAAERLADALKSLPTGAVAGALAGLGALGLGRAATRGRGGGGGKTPLLFGLGPVGLTVTAGIAIAGAGISRNREERQRWQAKWNSLSAKDQWRVYEANPKQIEGFLDLMDAKMKPRPKAPELPIGRRRTTGDSQKPAPDSLKPLSSPTPMQRNPAAKKKMAGGAAKVQELLPASLRVGLATAEVTTGTADDIRVLTKIDKWLEQRIRVTKNVNRKIEMLEALAQVRNKLEGLRPATVERTRMSNLFGGPFLTGDAFSTAASFGYKAKPRDLLRDLRMQNAQLTTLSRALRRLQRRGAPGALVEEIRGMGLEGADEASALAGANKGTFRQYLKAFRYRERAEERIQHMEVKSHTVTVNASNVNVHGTRGDVPGQQTFRRTSTRSRVRRAGGGSGR